MRDDTAAGGQHAGAALRLRPRSASSPSSRRSRRGSQQSGANVNDVDGVRVNSTEDGWWLLRASNTQDVLVARCEARDEAGLGRLKAALVDQLKRSGVEPPRI